MKLFVCLLLMPLLLLLFCCHCLAAVHEKAYADNQNSIYKTNPRFNAIRSDVSANKRSYDHFLTTNSSRADLPCPEAAAIAPCTCTVDSNNKIVIDCTFVESVDQLVGVFQQEFPVRELYRFSMTNNSAIIAFPSFMNGITFESVVLNPGPFALADISEHFLYDLKDTLTEFRIYDSKLTTDFFPFFIIPFLNQLQYFGIYYSDISWIPPIRASSLPNFVLAYSPIELLLNGTFPIGPGPMEILVYGNLIHTIEVGSFFLADQNSADINEPITINLSSNQLQSLKAGTFPLGNGPMTIYFYSNQMSSIEPGTFVLPASTGGDSNELISYYLYDNRLHSLKAGTFPLRNGRMTIDLFTNEISSIEPGTFVLPASTDSLKIVLELDINELTTVDETVFGSIMPFIIHMYLADNPLTCECDMAWLIVNEDFMDTVGTSATCANGTHIHDLDPQQYIDLC